MVQGTSSHAGKSILATALCRIFAQDGFQVAPFKAQNMSLNSHATPDGAEIGRSQAVQAAAAMTGPRVEMNPVLLKPEGERQSQVVVMGQPHAVASAQEYQGLKPAIWKVVTSALGSLRAEYEVIVIEGAGSPVEINLKMHDIANMRVALHAGAPVLLVGDIDRGGVFAQVVGTMALLEPEEKALVKGLVINKFRGDPSLLAAGLTLLEEHTGTSVAGVIPYFSDIHIPEEDSLGLTSGYRSDQDEAVEVAIIRLPHIANFDDFDPLHHEPTVRVRYVDRAEEFGNPDLVIIPGSKTTVADLHWLRTKGLAEHILTARQRGRPVIGICAGYQMLGMRLLDPDGVESSKAETPGLGLLKASTTFQEQKATHLVRGRVVDGRGLLSGCQDAEVSAYEIHMVSLPISIHYTPLLWRLAQDSTWTQPTVP
ncbi:MAG: cobyric acid synthase [Actinomycetia bacterium]|nr:cobyric acid synthase [Actinomycetes bacterium]